MGHGGKRAGAGRPKGAPSKRTAAVRDLLESAGCDPVKILSKMALDEDTKQTLRIDCAKALLPYLHPRLSASQVELSMAAMPSVTIEYVKPE